MLSPAVTIQMRVFSLRDGLKCLQEHVGRGMRWHVALALLAQSCRSHIQSDGSRNCKFPLSLLLPVSR